MSFATDTVTHALAGASITVNTEDLFRAWLAQQLATSSFSSNAAEQRIATFSAPLLRDGEHWAGIILNDDAPAESLILMPGDIEVPNWDEGLAWCKGEGGDLPTRREQALLYANLPKHFKREWYWSNEQASDDPSSAWMQYFGYGGQSCYRMSGKYRVRPVRRFKI